MTTRRSGLGCRETSGPPEKSHGALLSVGCPLHESGERIREHTRCGCTQFDWVAEVGQTHRASSSPGGRKTCWRTRALARKKSVAPLTRGADGQKAKRCACVRFPTSFLAYDLRVSACRLSIRQKAFSGFCPSCSYRRDEAGSSGFQVNTTSAAYGRKAAKLMLDSASGGFGFRLGRAWE